MSIGAVAARNIAGALSLGESQVGVIEQAIKDEIQAMSSHFTLAIADVQTQYEVEVAKVKADFVWVKANKAKIFAVATTLLSVGGLVGHFV
jgi:hypothetical protein